MKEGGNRYQHKKGNKKVRQSKIKCTSVDWVLKIVRNSLKESFGTEIFRFRIGE